MEVRLGRSPRADEQAVTDHRTSVAFLLRTLDYQLRASVATLAIRFLPLCYRIIQRGGGQSVAAVCKDPVSRYPQAARLGGTLFPVGVVIQRELAGSKERTDLR